MLSVFNMNKYNNVLALIILLIILLDFVEGIMVGSTKKSAEISYETTTYSEYNPLNEVEMFNDFAIGDENSNWRAYLSTNDFKYAWTKSKSWFETVVDKVNERINATFPDLRANVANTLKKNRFQAIYLGTLWCGDGTKARDHREIGHFYQTDACCREHDLCPEAIESNETKYNLTNTGRFTRSSCDCDQKFYHCLKAADTMVSRQVGYIFFNILGPQCFREEHPIVNCTRFVRNRCYTYVVDDEQPKLYQWFDNKRF